MRGKNKSSSRGRHRQSQQHSPVVTVQSAKTHCSGPSDTSSWAYTVVMAIVIVLEKVMQITCSRSAMKVTLFLGHLALLTTDIVASVVLQGLVNLGFASSSLTGAFAVCLSLTLPLVIFMTILEVCVCDGFAPCSPHGFMAYEGTCAREPPGTHASSLGNHLAASEAKPGKKKKGKKGNKTGGGAAQGPAPNKSSAFMDHPVVTLSPAAESPKQGAVVINDHLSPLLSLRKSSSSDTYSSDLSGHDDGFSHIVKKSVVIHRSASINSMPSGSTAKDIAGYTPTTRGAWSGVRSKSCGTGSSTPLVGRKVSLAVAMTRWAGQVLCNLVRLQIRSSPIKTYRQIRGDGDCGYRAVVVGLIEAAHADHTLRLHLVTRLEQLFNTVSSWTFATEAICAYDLHLAQGYTHLRALLENKRNDLVEKLLAPCRQQPASDQMVLFVRAITAAACLQSHSLSLEVFSSSLRADGLQCDGWVLEDFLLRYVMRLASACWQEEHGSFSYFDDLSASLLSSMLGVVLEVSNVSSELTAPLVQRCPDAASCINVRLMLQGGHYDLLYT